MAQDKKDSPQDRNERRSAFRERVRAIGTIGMVDHGRSSSVLFSSRPSYSLGYENIDTYSSTEMIPVERQQATSPSPRVPFSLGARTTVEAGAIAALLEPERAAVEAVPPSAAPK